MPSLAFQMTPLHPVHPVQVTPFHPVQRDSPPPVEEEDPFAYFGEPAQQSGTSEPTRPGVFLPGVEASRRIEENKASLQPPRVPVFGGSSGAIPKLFAEKMAKQAEEELLGAAPPQQAYDMLSETARSDMAAIKVEYFPSGQKEPLGHNEATVPGTQKVPSFSIPPSLREPLSKARVEESFDLADTTIDFERRALSQEFSAPESSAQELSAQEFSAQEASEQGSLASLLSAASEDIVHDKDVSELRKADESEIRRAFVQSKTKAKRRKRFQRFLKAVVFLLVVACLLAGVVIYWKEGKVFHQKTNGDIDWEKTFSWGRLKKNLFSKVVEEDMANGLYARHFGQEVFSVPKVHAHSLSKSPSQG